MALAFCCQNSKFLFSSWALHSRLGIYFRGLVDFHSLCEQRVSKSFQPLETKPCQQQRGCSGNRQSHFSHATCLVLVTRSKQSWTGLSFTFPAGTFFLSFTFNHQWVKHREPSRDKGQKAGCSHARRVSWAWGNLTQLPDMLFLFLE